MEGPPEVYIMDGDIKKACDFVSRKAVAEAAREKGMDEVVVLTWPRYWRSMNIIFRLDAGTMSDEIERPRSLPQGDPAAPMIFNLVLDTIAENLSRRPFECVGGPGRKLGQLDHFRGQLLAGSHNATHA